ncbi:MAG: hypothetical protein ABDH16_07145 [Thermodesulfovibrionaceae bacterium]
MVVKEIFGRYLEETAFINSTYDILKEYNFTSANSIASACLCRDELCQTALVQIKNIWGEVFNFSSLGGLYTAGITGLKAFLSHAPDFNGARRCVFYVFSHIGVDENGILGKCSRKGIIDSNACGALIFFLNELSKKTVSYSDVADEEQNYLKKRLLSEINLSNLPNLLELTKISLRATVKDIESLMQGFVKSDRIEYALISGIQVHYLNRNYIIPEEFIVFEEAEIRKIEIL